MNAGFLSLISYILCIGYSSNSECITGKGDTTSNISTIDYYTVKFMSKHISNQILTPSV